MGTLANQMVSIPPLDQGAVHLQEVKRKKGSEAAYISAIANDMKAEEIPLFIDHAHIVFRVSSESKKKAFLATLARLVDKGKQPVVLVGNPTLALLCESAVDVNIVYVQMPCFRTDTFGITEITKQVDSFEKKIGERFCQPGSIKNHSADIASLADARIGIVVDALKSAFESDCVWGHKALSWGSVEKELRSVRANSAVFGQERKDIEGRAKSGFFAWSFDHGPPPEGNTVSEGNDSESQSASDGRVSEFGEAVPSSDAAAASEENTPDHMHAGQPPGDGQLMWDESAADDNMPPKKRRRRRSRFGRTKPTNRPLHPYGNSDPETQTG
jgi:hypothetical protein